MLSLPLLIVTSTALAVAAIAARIVTLRHRLRFQSMEGALWLLALASGCAALFRSIALE